MDNVGLPGLSQAPQQTQSIEANSAPPPMGAPAIAGAPQQPTAQSSSGQTPLTSAPPPTGAPTIAGAPQQLTAQSSSGQTPLTSAPPPMGAPAIAGAPQTQLFNQQIQPKGEAFSLRPSGGEHLVAEAVRDKAEGASQLLEIFKKIEEHKAPISRMLGAGADFVGRSSLSDRPARAVIGAIDKAQNALFKTQVADSKAFQTASDAANFISGAAAATARGQSPIAAVVDGFITAAVDRIPNFAIIDVIADRAQKIAGMAGIGQYTKELTATTPGRMLKGIGTAIVDGADDVLRGDPMAILHHMEEGHYSGGLRSAGMVIEAVVTRFDHDTMNRLSRGAESGKMGSPAKFGDQLGDLLGRKIPAPLSLVRRLPW